MFKPEDEEQHPLDRGDVCEGRCENVSLLCTYRDKLRNVMGKETEEEKKKNKTQKSKKKKEQKISSCAQLMAKCCSKGAPGTRHRHSPELKSSSCHPHSQQKSPPSQLQGLTENMNLILGSVTLKSAQFQ